MNQHPQTQFRFIEPVCTAVIVSFATRDSTAAASAVLHSSGSSGCSSGLNQIKLSLFPPYELIVNESMRYIEYRRFQLSTHRSVC
jgi:hypothetical protein